MGAEGRGFPWARRGCLADCAGRILFDVANGGDKDWGDTPPYGQFGRDAYGALSRRHFALGNGGVGFGAQAGQLKGGLGMPAPCLTQMYVSAHCWRSTPLGAVIDEVGTFWVQHALAMDGAPEFGLPSLIGQASRSKSPSFRRPNLLALPP